MLIEAYHNFRFSEQQFDIAQLCLVGMSIAVCAKTHKGVDIQSIWHFLLVVRIEVSPHASMVILIYIKSVIMALTMFGYHRVFSLFLKINRMIYSAMTKLSVIAP